MKLVGPEYLSENDREFQCVMDEHPYVKYMVTWLINTYREIARNCIDGMQNGETDTADAAISCVKKDAVLRHMDILILDTPADWWELDKLRRAWLAQSEEK